MTPERRKEMNAKANSWVGHIIADMLAEALAELDAANARIAKIQAYAAERNELNTR